MGFDDSWSLFFVSFRFQLRFEVFVLRSPWLPWFLKGMGLDARTDLGSYSNSLNVFNFLDFWLEKTGSNVSCDQGDLSYNLR